MTNILWFALFCPFASFLMLTVFSGILKRKTAQMIGCCSIMTSFFLFCWFLFLYQQHHLNAFQNTLFQWISAKGIDAGFTIYIDTLSLVMALIVTGVGSLIHIYSIGYMEHEESVVRYFACMNLFVFFMLLLVLSGHLLLLFIGWEGVGLASYLLIGYWYTRPAAAKAATKAFVMNRIADVGLIIGILLTIYLFGSGNFMDIFSKMKGGSLITPSLLTAVTLLYFVGSIGKSAQLPLYNWLPDAMEGPTPVSALIHAATMVTAGVYLLVRMHPLLLQAPYTMEVIGILGASTALFAAVCALGQTDLKRVLAFSTMSQLGYMFLACGVGSFFSAMFHLGTHAFVKSLLFLCAGTVVHKMNTTNMEKMGGLKKRLPITHGLFLVGVLAMSGIPPLSAFFSKDLILEKTRLGGHSTLYIVALFSAFLTAFYLTRAYCLTFLGEEKIEKEKLKSVKEAPRIMLIPCFILCLLTLVGGGLKQFFLKIHLERGEKIPEFHLLSIDLFFSLAVALLGILSAFLLYTRFKDRLGENLAILKNAFYVDDIYEKVFVIPLKILSSLIVYIVEPLFFRRPIEQIGIKTLGFAQTLQKLQNGVIRFYIVWIFLGVALLLFLI